MTGSRKGAGARGGFVLLAVLVVFALAAGLVGAMSLIARSAVDGAALERDQLAADLALDAGVTLAAWQLIGLGRPAADVSGQEIRFDTGTVRLAVAGEAGRVDLNGASPVLLAAAWRAAGRRSLPPETFADRVVDWRDPDADKEENGAEQPDYDDAGLPPPRNGPFRTTGDLAAVLGVDAADAAALGPLVTVYNPDGRLSAREAPRALLGALPGLSRERPAVIPAALEGAVIAEPGVVFRIRAELFSGPVPRAVEAVVIPAATGGAAFHVVARWDALR